MGDAVRRVESTDDARSPDGRGTFDPATWFDEAVPLLFGYFIVRVGGEVDPGIANMEIPFSLPVQMWGTNPIVITGMGDVYVIEDATG